MKKFVPEVLHKDWDQRLRSVHRPRAQFFLIRTSRLANNIFFIYLFLLKLLLAFLVTNSLLSAGRKDGKILPAHEPIRLQDSFYLAHSCSLKKIFFTIYCMTSHMAKSTKASKWLHTTDTCCLQNVTLSNKSCS